MLLLILWSGDDTCKRCKQEVQTGRELVSRHSPLPVLKVEEELALLEEEVVVVEEELEEEVVAVDVEDVLEEAVEAGMSPSMSAALWECDRQRALIGSKPSCRQIQSSK